MLLSDCEEMIALHVHDFLTSAKGKCFAFHLEDRSPVNRLDAKRVSRQRKDLFLENKRLRLSSNEALEDADGLCDGG